MNGAMPEALEEAFQELVGVQGLVAEFATADPLGSVVTDVRMTAGVLGGRVWLETRETATYQVEPYEVLRHLLVWVEDYGKRWDRR